MNLSSFFAASSSLPAFDDDFAELPDDDNEPVHKTEVHFPDGTRTPEESSDDK